METPVQDIMNTQIETVSETMPVDELAMFLTDHQISGAPVVDAQGRLTGVVSLADIVESGDGRIGSESEEEASPFFAQGWENKLNIGDFVGLEIKNEALAVRDIMTPTLYTVPYDTPVNKVARTMVSGRIHRLLVTKDEKVVGLVTSLDLLKLLCE